MNKTEPIAQVKQRPKNRFNLKIKNVDLGDFEQSELQHIIQIIDNKIFN